jgi:hypothetical protein
MSLYLYYKSKHKKTNQIFTKYMINILKKNPKNLIIKTRQIINILKKILNSLLFKLPLLSRVC